LNNSVILYEYPLQERIRTYLRLEHLFIHLQQLLPRVDAMDHHFALASMFEILEVSSRADLKSDLLKDLDRQKHILDSYRGNPAIAEAVLDEVIQKLDQCFASLNDLPGKIGQPLTENDWLMAIRSRIVIPGGTCGFDLPAYHAWQHKPAALRQAQLREWALALKPMADTIHLLLKLLRDSGAPQKVIVNNGQWQQSLPQGRTFLLLRLAIDESLDIVPEISGNRLMVSVRLMRQGEDNRLQTISEDASMELALCA
jgi:cell division protein ZapD